MMAATVVVDVSLAIKWAISEPYSVEARTLLGDWVRDGTERLAPALFAYEAANALYRKRPANDGSGWVSHNLNGLLMAVTLRPVLPNLVERAAEIADLTGQPAAYDAQHEALAEAEGCELWTADERFWIAAQQHFRWVRWIGSMASS